MEFSSDIWESGDTVWEHENTDNRQSRLLARRKENRTDLPTVPRDLTWREVWNSGRVPEDFTSLFKLNGQ